MRILALALIAALAHRAHAAPVAVRPDAAVILALLAGAAQPGVWRVW